MDHITIPFELFETFQNAFFWRACKLHQTPKLADFMMKHTVSALNASFLGLPCPMGRHRRLLLGARFIGHCPRLRFGRKPYQHQSGWSYAEYCSQPCPMTVPQMQTNLRYTDAGNGYQVHRMDCRYFISSRSYFSIIRNNVFIWTRIVIMKPTCRAAASERQDATTISVTVGSQFCFDPLLFLVQRYQVPH